MERVDFVVHAAAALPRYAPADIYSSEINGSRNVLHASLQAKVERDVYISSTAVYGTSPHHSSVESGKLSGIPVLPDNIESHLGKLARIDIATLKEWCAARTVACGQRNTGRRAATS